MEEVFIVEQSAFDFGYEFDNANVEKNPSGMRIIQAKFSSAKNKSFEDLFYNGKYDTLYAITFSSSFELIFEAAKKFRYTEIILGNQHAVNNTMSAVIASQMFDVDWLKKDKRYDEIVSLIREDRLKIYLVKGNISHAKMYLLSGENGVINSIIGSSNFSIPAWKSSQREINIEFPGDKDAYEYGLSVFADIKRQSTTELNLDIIKKERETSAKETPIIAVVEVEKEIRVPVYIKEEQEEFEFARKREDFIRHTSEHLDGFMPKPRAVKGAVTYRYDLLQKAIMDAAADIRENENVRKEVPRLVVDCETKKIEFMDMDFVDFVNNQYDFTTVRSDLECLSSYMYSFDKFLGDPEKTRDAVWKLLCYSFASPFMCRLRRCAAKNGYLIYAYPMFALIYGAASTSKTSMIKIIRTMMIGKTSYDLGLYPSDFFKKTIISESLRLTQVGLPIFIDDLSDSQYARHGENIIKDETFETRNKGVDSPSVIITTNRVKSISKDISKRCLCLRPNSQVTQDAMLLNAKEFSDFCDSFSPKLFIRFLEEMIPRVNDIEALMEKGDVSVAPDILAISSGVLIDIAEKEFGFVPEYMTKIDFVADAFGEEAIGGKKVDELKEYFSLNPDMFEFRGNKVFVRFDSTREATTYYQELPRYACINQNNNHIICDAKHLESYGIKKPSVWNRIFSNK